MASRRKKTAPETGTVINLHTGTTADDAADAEEIEQLDKIEGGELFRALDEIRAVTGAKVEVYRLEPSPGFCFNYPVALFSQEKVAADWGPGKYKIRFKGDKNRYIDGGGTIDIAAPLNAGADVRAPQTGGVTDVLAILKADRDKQTAQWWEIAKMIAPLAIPKLLEMFSGNRGPSITELMQLMVSAKEFHKPAPTQTMEQQIEQFTRLMEVAQTLTSKGNDTGTTWPDLIREGITQLPAAIGAIRSGIPMTGPLLPAPQPSSPSVLVPATQVIPPTATAATNGASSPVNSVNGGADMDLRTLPWLKATLGSLLVQAANDRDPDLYAQVTVDNLPNYVNPAWLLQTLERPDWWEMLVGAEPSVTPYVGWFKAYHEMLLDLLRQAISTQPSGAQPPSSDAANEDFH